MASASFDWEKSWPTIAVSRALSASINGAVLGAAGSKSLLGTAAANLRLDDIDRLQALDQIGFLSLSDNGIGGRRAAVGHDISELDLGIGSAGVIFLLRECFTSRNCAQHDDACHEH
jgi:hypothetical protein